MSHSHPHYPHTRQMPLTHVLSRMSSQCWHLRCEGWVEQTHPVLLHIFKHLFVYWFFYLLSRPSFECVHWFIQLQLDYGSEVKQRLRNEIRRLLLPFLASFAYWTEESWTQSRLTGAFLAAHYRTAAPWRHSFWFRTFLPPSFHPSAWPLTLIYPICGGWWSSWNLKPVWRGSR